MPRFSSEAFIYVALDYSAHNGMNEGPVIDGGRYRAGVAAFIATDGQLRDPVGRSYERSRRRRTK